MNKAIKQKENQQKDGSTDVLICQCHTAEHNIIIHYLDGFVYVDYHLVKHGLWTRLKYAFKYLFGFQSKYGAYGEMILNPDDWQKVQEIADYLKGDKE